MIMTELYVYYEEELYILLSPVRRSLFECWKALKGYKIVVIRMYIDDHIECVKLSELTLLEILKPIS